MTENTCGDTEHLHNLWLKMPRPFKTIDSNYFIEAEKKRKGTLSPQGYFIWLSGVSQETAAQKAER